MRRKSVYTGLILMVIIFATLLHGTESRKHKNRTIKSKYRHATGFTFNGGGLRNVTRLQNVICDIICDGDECTEYYCPDGYICCTPGSPTSKCCEDDHPICVSDGCCPAGAPTECGEYCCETGSLCCIDECCDEDELCCDNECCESGNLCCGTDCCDRGEICCGGSDCCGNACCGEKCCEDNESCCGGTECCNDVSSICCDDNGCHTPCSSQFDELPCSESMQTALKFQMAATCPNISTYVYRIIRPDEDPKVGLLAKNKGDNKSPDSQVGCGSRVNYTSQFISLTSSLDIAHSYYNISKAKGLNPRIAMVKYDDVKQNAEKIYDLTIPGVRTQYLLNEINRNNSANACEILVVNRDKAIPFTIIS